MDLPWGAVSQHPGSPREHSPNTVLETPREGLTQGVTRLILPGTYVQTRQQDGMVVACAVSAHQPRLPLAEAA